VDTIRFEPGQVALFGYGSLLSVAALEETLGKSYRGPFVMSQLRGWRRKWEAAMPNQSYYTETAAGRMYPESILYLNIAPDTGTVLNGSVFAVSAEELCRIDEDESIYDRVEVGSSLETRVEGGPVYAYVCRPHYRKSEVSGPREAAIRSTYLDSVNHGLAALGEEFRTAYERSTDPVPKHLVIADQK